MRRREGVGSFVLGSGGVCFGLLITTLLIFGVSIKITATELMQRLRPKKTTLSAANNLFSSCVMEL